MGLKAKTGSHLPVLIEALRITDGDVLEMGMGFFSTPFLHWACLNRKLVSYESEAGYFWKFADGFHTDNHLCYLIEDWDKAEIDKTWDVVLIDHGPSERRAWPPSRWTFAGWLIWQSTSSSTTPTRARRNIIITRKYFLCSSIASIM
jgi:hypothetical protein